MQSNSLSYICKDTVLSIQTFQHPSNTRHFYHKLPKLLEPSRSHPPSNPNREQCTSNLRTLHMSTRRPFPSNTSSTCHEAMTTTSDQNGRCEAQTVPDSRAPRDPTPQKSYQNRSQRKNSSNFLTIQSIPSVNVP